MAPAGRLSPHRPARRARQQELNTGLTLIDQNWWSVRLATHFLKHDYEEYLLEYRQRINETFDITGLWRYDAKNEPLQRTGATACGSRLGRPWAIKYEVSFFDGPRRESSLLLRRRGAAAEVLTEDSIRANTDYADCRSGWRSGPSSAILSSAQVPTNDITQRPTPDPARPG